MMRIVESTGAFVAIYVLVALPTYVLPYFGSNSALTMAFFYVNPMFWLHLVLLIGLVVLSWFRGTLVQRKWLVALPAIAALFDLVPLLSMIPLVPTVFHLLAVILGSLSRK